MTITAAIITNKLPLSPLLLSSLSFANEIIVIIDTPISRHRERSVAIQKGDRLPRFEYETRNDNIGKIKIFFHPLNNDFSAQRNFALQKAKSEWVLFIDDDEYVGTELAREIIEAIKNSNFNGYLIKRLDVAYHTPLLHGETGNIKILRLARRTSGEFQRPVHETWKIDGRVGELRSPLYHHKDHFISEFISRMDQYGHIDSRILTTEGKPFSWLRLLIYPLAKFKLNYIFRAGFLDGTAGLFLAYLMAVQSLTVRVFQWQNQN